MKKYFFIVTVLLLTIGFSAFKISNNKTKATKMQTLVWHKYNDAGNAELVPAVTFSGTAAGAKLAFGCPDGTIVICARGYDSEGNPTSQYVNKSPQ